MSFRRFYLVAAFIFIIVIQLSAQLYKLDSKIVKKSLSEIEFNNLIKYLLKDSAIHLKDTIIIKYDFNKENCWDMLDQENNEYIKIVIANYQKRIWQIKNERKAISVFEYREAGKKINKFKKWNTNIKVDSTNELYKLIFKKKTTCGSSAIILGDRRVIIIPSDAHFEALGYNAERIKQILSH